MNNGYFYTPEKKRKRKSTLRKIKKKAVMALKMKK